MRNRCLFPVLFVWTLSMVPVSLQAGASQPEERPSRQGTRVENWGWSAWVKGTLGRVDLEDLERSAAPVVVRLAREHFGATGRESLSFDRLNRDTFGRAHVRFEEKLHGLRVVGSSLTLHIDLATGEAVGVHGRFAPEAAWLPRTPGLAAGEALELAAAEAGLAVLEICEDRELVYYLPYDSEDPVLAWTATVRYVEGDLPLSDSLFADAATGALLGREQHQAPSGYQQTYDLQNKEQYHPPDPDPGVLVLSNTRTEGTGTEDVEALAAHENAGEYHFALAGLFGRSSIDGKNGVLKTGIREATLYKNTFHAEITDRIVLLSNGDDKRYEVAAGVAYDLVAHEQSHLLIYLAGGLGYSKDTPSGSLHEALADIFASATESYLKEKKRNLTYGKLGSPLLMFDQVFKQKGCAAERFLSDPVKDNTSECGKGSIGSVDYWSEFSLDPPVPHRNAGILNLAFSLLSNGGRHPQSAVHGTRVDVQGVGYKQAAAIFYNALLSMPGDFEGFRTAALEAAISGFGLGSAQHKATHDAFCEVGFFCDTAAPLVHVDVPANYGRVSGNATIAGWATDASGVVGGSMRFRVDGQWLSSSEATYGVSRQDVCNYYPTLQDPNCPAVGWSGTIDTSKYSNGYHTLWVFATDALGFQRSAARQFYVDNPPVTVTFSPVADSWVRHDDPYRNFGSDSFLSVRSDATGHGKHTYLKFTVSGVSGSVTSAKLRIRTAGVKHPSSRVYHIADTSWGEYSIKWSNAPLYFLSQWPVGPLAAREWHEIDVSSIVNGNGTYTIGLVGPDTPYLNFYSRESAYPPSLIVSYRP